jgi:hypothetical protein
VSRQDQLGTAAVSGEIVRVGRADGENQRRLGDQGVDPHICAPACGANVHQVIGVGIVHGDPQAVHRLVPDLGAELFWRGLAVRAPAHDHVDLVVGDAQAV